MTLCLLARDYAPSQALRFLAQATRLPVTSVIRGTGDSLAKTKDNTIAQMVRGSQLLILGMSSDEERSHQERLAAQIAAESHVPYGFYADTFGVVNRPHFAKAMTKASFVFVINQKEAKKGLVAYPNVEFVVSGNPLWEKFFYPRYQRNEIRDRLEFWSKPVTDQTKIILSPGGKSFVMNTLLWGSLINACHRIRDIEDLRICLCHHPSDKHLPAEYANLAIYSHIPTIFLNRQTMTYSDILPGIDMVVQSASTIGLEAACQRIPVIDYFSPLASNRLAQAIGTTIWDPCEVGASQRADDEWDLSHFIKYYLTDGYMKAGQESAFPQPAIKGESLAIMVDTIKRFIR